MAKATMDVNRYSKHVTFYLTKLGYYPIILGMLLLKRHDPWILFNRSSILFNSAFCCRNCNCHHALIRACSDVTSTSNSTAIDTIATKILLLPNHSETLHHLQLILLTTLERSMRNHKARRTCASYCTTTNTALPLLTAIAPPPPTNRHSAADQDSTTKPIAHGFLTSCHLYLPTPPKTNTIRTATSRALKRRRNHLASTIT